MMGQFDAVPKCDETAGTGLAGSACMPAIFPCRLCMPIPEQNSALENKIVAIPCAGDAGDVALSGCRTALHPEVLSIVAALESKGIRVAALAGGGSDPVLAGARLAALSSLGLDKVARESMVRLNLLSTGRGRGGVKAWGYQAGEGCET